MLWGDFCFFLKLFSLFLSENTQKNLLINKNNHPAHDVKPSKNPFTIFVQKEGKELWPKKNSKQPKPGQGRYPQRKRNLRKRLRCGNWKRVVHLLSLPLENAERRDRYHGKLSINFTYKKKEMT